MKERKIAASNKIKEGKGFLTRIEGEEITLFKVEGKFFAIGNVCPHQHFSELHEGQINGYVLTCPMHGWSYDVRTGYSTNASSRVKSYEVIIRGDEVFIRKNGNADSTD